MHLVRNLARQLPSEWLHQEVPLSAYLFPSAPGPTSLRIDIGIVDPARLSPRLTAQEMAEVRWDAFIEVKFRGNSPGFEFAAAPTSSIASDVEKLQRLRAHCDHASSW